MKWKLRVVERSKLWLAVSGLMAVVALVSLLTQGLNYGIDFTGGVIMDLRFSKPTTVGDIRGVLARHGQDDAVIREASGAEATAGSAPGREFLITTRSLSDGERRAIFADLEKALGKFDILSVDQVSPVIGAELRRNALTGIALATVGMLIYITVRFEWKFGLAAIVALLHDVFLTVGFFSVFRLPVDTSFVAAILTVFGYSINDTIIVFDRVRENLANRKREALGDLVDRSINQVLTRSINTALTTIMAIAAVYLFGGRTLKDLSLALMVGIGFGAYSSIFVASPLYVAIAEGLARRSRAGVRAA